MGRFEQTREVVRRAYEASRTSLRAARERAEQPNGEGDELAVTAEPPTQAGSGPEPAGSVRAGSVRAGSVPAGSASEAAPQPEPAGQSPVDDAVPRSLHIAAAWSWRLIVIAAVGWALLWIANRFLLLVAPLMIALLLAGLLMPAHRALLKLRIHRSFAALLVMIGGIAAVGGTLYLVVLAFIDGVAELAQQVQEAIGQIEDWLRNGPLQMDDTDLENLVAQGQQWLDQNTQELTTASLAAVTGTIQFLTGMTLVIVVTFFFLRDGARIWQFVVGTLPLRARGPMAFAGDGAWRSLSGYVRATVLVALVDAVGVALGLLILSWVMSFPRGLVLPLAALVFLGAFVPIVGAFVSGTVAVLVGLVAGDTVTERLAQALIVFGIILLVQQLEGNVLQPFIVSKMVRIHPLAVIIAVMAGILLAGIIGALVAVPIVAVLNTVVRRLNHYHQRRRNPPAEIETAPAGP